MRFRSVAGGFKSCVGNFPLAARTAVRVWFEKPARYDGFAYVGASAQLRLNRTEVAGFLQPTDIEGGNDIFARHTNTAEYAVPSTSPAGCPVHIQYVGPQPPALSK